MVKSNMDGIMVTTLVSESACQRPVTRIGGLLRLAVRRI